MDEGRTSWLFLGLVESKEQEGKRDGGRDAGEKRAGEGDERGKPAYLFLSTSTRLCGLFDGRSGGGIGLISKKGETKIRGGHHDRGWHISRLYSARRGEMDVRVVPVLAVVWMCHSCM